MQRMNFTRQVLGFRNGILSFCLIMAVLSLNAQTSFHRLYPSKNDRKIITINSTQSKDGHYISMHHLVSSPDDSTQIWGDTLIITSYKAKGDMEWSKMVGLKDVFDKVHHTRSSIVIGNNDSIYFSIIVEKEGKFSNLIGALDKNGNFKFIKSYVLDDKFSTLDGKSHLLANFKNSILNAYSVDGISRKEKYVTRLNYLGDTLWTKSLSVADRNNENIALQNFKVSKNNFLTSGTISSANSKAYILVLDSLSNPVLSKNYRDSLSKTAQITDVGVVRMADSSFVVTGNITDKLTPNGRNRTNGFIIKTDKIGDIQWSKKVSFPGDSATILNGCIINRNNDIVIGGVTLNPTGKNRDSYIVRMTAKGEVVWKKRYVQAVNSSKFIGGSLYEAIDWGLVLMSTGTNDKGKICPSFIKTDTDGATSCEKDITEEIFSGIKFISDTLKWNVKNIFKVKGDKSKITGGGVYNFDIPVIGLDIKTFCAKEPIDWTFDATINNAATYKWSDGSTDSKLRVFDEGEYSVTVTVNDNVCYMLCDTAKLDRYGLPKATLNLTLGNFCTNGKQTLRLGYGPGHPIIKSVSWSTGDTGKQSIEIASPGTYSVTIVDGCDEVADTSIVVGEFPKPITAASIEDHINVDCAYGDLSGSLEASGNAQGLGQNTYLWNTGFTGKRLVVESVQTLFYQVTVTDQCGNTATASKSFEIKGDNKLKLDIAVDESRKCTEGIIRLNAYLATQSPKIKYQWDYQNATTPAIEVKNAGTYRVTVTDACGNTLTSSKTVDFKGSLDMKAFVDVDFDELCEKGQTKMTLFVNPQGSYDYKWSTGETTRDVTISGGTFTVTITDHCDNHYQYPFIIDFENLFYAKVFFPDGTFAPNAHIDTMVTHSANYKNAEMYNRSFGPVNFKGQCFEQVKDYELHVFNRWGQEVFVSKNINEEWDGTYKGQPAPSEAYLWVVRYKQFDKLKEAKGSVTLIRM